MCKYLTPEIFNKFKGTKDKAGVAFELMVLSGAQNVDSGIGLYAGSHDSYTTYAELFDKVIEDYHGHKKDGKHVSDMDHTKLKCPPFNKEDNARILSTRIRVGRNLAAYPLGPGISAAQRNEVEATVSLKLGLSVSRVEKVDVWKIDETRWDVDCSYNRCPRVG